MKLIELQLDRLVGPTHHFGGLGVGNLASAASVGQVSNPAAAAIQGLDKMRLVASLGVPQLVLPPQLRPNLDFLRAVGFGGTDRELLSAALDQAPELLSAAFSCSAMWTANAATATAGVDSGKANAQVTVANLNASLHRVVEPDQTQQDLGDALRSIADVHPPIPGGTAMRDEGAANQMRLGSDQNRVGIHLFVYGDGEPMPTLNWPRQARSASQAVARTHRLPAENTFFLHQHNKAIDAGAFHNDVVAMSHQDLLIYHQDAFIEDDSVLAAVERRYEELYDRPLRRIVVSADSLPLTDAVRTYLFNSQIVSTDRSIAPWIICTRQVQAHPAARAIVDRWCVDGLFGEARYVDLDQSMSGGGGPACLRLRIPIPESELKGCSGTRWSEALDQELREIIERDYPSQLQLSDLADNAFCQHARETADKIGKVIGSQTD